MRALPVVSHSVDPSISLANVVKGGFVSRRLCYFNLHLLRVVLGANPEFEFLIISKQLCSFLQSLYAQHGTQVSLALELFQACANSRNVQKQEYD